MLRWTYTMGKGSSGMINDDKSLTNPNCVCLSVTLILPNICLPCLSTILVCIWIAFMLFLTAMYDVAVFWKYIYNFNHNYVHATSNQDIELQLFMSRKSIYYHQCSEYMIFASGLLLCCSSRQCMMLQFFENRFTILITIMFMQQAIKI